MAHVPPHRVLILGCGYVGSAVADVAQARGWEVAALTRNVEKARALAAGGVNVVMADLAGTEWHDRIGREYDVVLNCVSSGGGGLAGYQRSYVEGMRSILQWAVPGVPATFVYTGSTSVYPQDGGEIVTESSPVGVAGSEAAAPLLETERMIREQSCFARWFILRLAGIYGPGRHYLVDQLRAGATLFPGTGLHRLNLAHRDDIVAAILACIGAPATVRNEIFNVCGDTAVTKQEVTAWLAQQLGRAPPMFARDGGERSSGTPAVRGRSGPVPDRLISNARLKGMLGWRPQYPDFRDGYRQVFEAERT